MSKLKYTVFTCTPDSYPCLNCQHTNCCIGANAPVKNNDNTKAIATGIFLKAPNATYHTQEEAEELKKTEEWVAPEASPKIYQVKA